MREQRRQLMFWNIFAGAYDFFETLFNGKVYREFSDKTAAIVDSDDNVLECACGTGVITVKAASRCKKITAMDFAPNMIKEAKKKCRGFDNVTIEEGNIMDLKYEDESFDKVIAANVIHLVDDPDKAFSEMLRVLKPGGQIILPTFLTANNKKRVRGSVIVDIFNKMGANFKVEFSLESYTEFLKDHGFADAKITLVKGFMPNAIAVISKKAAS